MEIVCENIKDAYDFVDKLGKYKIELKDTMIGILYQQLDSVCIKKLKIDKVELDIELNYGKEFVDVHNVIKNKLENNPCGITILRGEVGTGKSSYIKYLAQIIDRLFIFIPVSQISSLVSPSLITTLINNPNSILVIEEAEQAVMSREDNPENGSLVSTILNLGDGLLSSMLKIGIILTFNTHVKNIDKATLRKGRLQAEWEFKNLSIENARRLAKKLGKNPNKIEKEMSLADIYGLDDVNFHKEKEILPIGFR